MPNIPNTTQNQYVLRSTGDGQNSSIWGQVIDDQDRTYAVSGTIAVPSGATNYLPPFIRAVASGATITLIGVWGLLRAGTATVSVNQNGAAISGLSAVSITTTLTYTPATIAPSVANGDLFAPVVSAVASADGMSVTFVFAVTL